MTRDLVLGLDVGTQGTKGVLVDLSVGEVVGRAAVAYGLLEGLGPGAAEQHPDTWLGAIAGVVGALDPDPARLAGIGVSGQQHGCVPVDGDGAVLRAARLWCDTATTAEAEALGQALGRPVPVGFTASKVMAFAREDPAAWGRCAHVLLPHDFVNLRLTGRVATEAGDASGTGYFDPATRSYDADALAAVDPALAARVPEVVPPDAPLGAVTEEAARWLGLGAAAVGVPVAAGGGDNMMSAIGSGATRVGTATVSLGTSGTIFAYADRPVVDPEGAVAAFCDSTGAWLPLLCVMNATGVLEEVRRAFDVDHATLTDEADAMSVGGDGLLWVPFLVGERTPDLPRATGRLFGVRPGSLTAGRLYRAGMEGVTWNLAAGLDHLRRSGTTVDRVRLVGGGARNRTWARLLAAALGVTIERPTEVESAALGAALQAAWAIGTEASIDALAGRFVRVDGDPIPPDPDLASACVGPRAAFDAAVASMRDEASGPT